MMPQHSIIGRTSYYKQGECDRAIEDFTKAIEFKPDFATAYNNRGNAFNNKDELNRAIEDYNKALDLKPDFAEAYYNAWQRLQRQRRVRLCHKRL